MAVIVGCAVTDGVVGGVLVAEDFGVQMIVMSVAGGAVFGVAALALLTWASLLVELLVRGFPTREETLAVGLEPVRATTDAGRWCAAAFVVFGVGFVWLGLAGLLASMALALVAHHGSLPRTRVRRAACLLWILSVAAVVVTLWSGTWGGAPPPWQHLRLW